jgi:hypothetical protein
MRRQEDDTREEDIRVWLNGSKPFETLRNGSKPPLHNHSISISSSMKKEETRNSDKTRKKETAPKKRFAENVRMTEAEHGRLVEKYGEDATARLIEKLDNAKGAKGYKYKSDYRAILSWVVDTLGVRPLPAQGKKCPECGEPLVGSACRACGWGKT